MTPALRLLFDDCLSKKAVIAMQALAEFSKGTVELAHLVDHGLSGAIDDAWIEAIKGQGWIIITTDRGKKPSRGGKLPYICQGKLVTHIMMSGSLHKRNTFDKLRAVFEVWPDILAASSAVAGCGYLLQDMGGTPSGRAKLAKLTEPPDVEDTRNTQTSFLE